MTQFNNYQQLVEAACKANGNNPNRTVIEKELLHYDILFALTENNLLSNLTFQGGTALRLCYGLQRYSEDLDFVGGENFADQDFSQIKTVLEGYIGCRYGLAVSVKEPNRKPAPKILVNRWQLAIETHPERKDLPKQKIRIEIVNVPAYSRKLRPLLCNYDFLPDGYEQIFLHVEGLEEIMADKIIAFAARDYLKARDIWDIQWLHSKNITVNDQLINKKIKDYGIKDFKTALSARQKEGPDFIAGSVFKHEMERFLEDTVLKRTLRQPGFNEYLVDTLLEVTSQAL